MHVVFAIAGVLWAVFAWMRWFSPWRRRKSTLVDTGEVRDRFRGARF